MFASCVYCNYKERDVSANGSMNVIDIGGKIEKYSNLDGIKWLLISSGNQFFFFSYRIFCASWLFNISSVS